MNESGRYTKIFAVGRNELWIRGERNRKPYIVVVNKSAYEFDTLDEALDIADQLAIQFHENYYIEKGLR